MYSPPATHRGPAWPLPGPGRGLPPHGSVLSVAALPALLSPQELPGEWGPHLPAPHLFPWGLIPLEGQGGSASCSPPACGLQPQREQVATAASPSWPGPGVGLTIGQNLAGLLQKGPRRCRSLQPQVSPNICHTLPRWTCQALGQRSWYLVFRSRS